MRGRARRRSAAIKVGGILLAMTLGGLGMVSSAQAAKSPWVNSSLADRPVRPTEFGPGLAKHQPKALTFTAIGNYVRDIQWSSWGGAEAVGSGQVSLLRGEESYETADWLPEEVSPVTVRFKGLRRCLGVQVYTAYLLELAPGAEAPLGWPRGQHGTFPCQKILSAFFNGAERRSRSGCRFTGLEAPFSPSERAPYFTAPEWRPRLPFKHARTLDFCDLHSRHWGSSIATLTGTGLALLHPYRQDRVWPVKLELQDPIWCPAATSEDPWLEGAAAVTYGTIRLTLYGTGPDLQPGPFPHPPPIGAKHIYWQHLHPRPAECLLGRDQRNPRYSPTGHHY